MSPQLLRLPMVISTHFLLHHTFSCSPLSIKVAKGVPKAPICYCHPSPHHYDRRKTRSWWQHTPFSCQILGSTPGSEKIAFDLDWAIERDHHLSGCVLYLLLNPDELAMQMGQLHSTAGLRSLTTLQLLPDNCWMSGELTTEMGSVLWPEHTSATIGGIRDVGILNQSVRLDKKRSRVCDWLYAWIRSCLISLGEDLKGAQLHPAVLENSMIRLHLSLSHINIDGRGHPFLSIVCIKSTSRPL